MDLKQRFADDTHVQAVQQTIDRLDHQQLRDVYRGTGSSPYPPELMLAIVLFMILRGVGSPAQWAENARTKDQCKLLGRGITPSRTTMYDFRDRAAKFIQEANDSVVRGSIDEGLLDPTDGCLDGTFVSATASRHRVYRITQISKRLCIVKRAIAQHDDPQQVASKRPLEKVPSWLAKTPSGRQQQLKRLRLAKAEILEQTRDNRSRPKSLRRKEASIVVSPLDPDAVIGKDKSKVVRPLYNVQYMCDFASDIVLAYGVFRKKNDTGTLIPMIQRTQQVTGDRLQRVHADSGYCSLLELEDCAACDVELMAPVADRVGSKGRPTTSGKPQLRKDSFDWDETEQQMTCPAGLPMRQVNRSKDPRGDGRFVYELRFEQSPDHCDGCPLADQCLAVNSKRRTIRRLENQKLLDEQAAKMDSDRGRTSVRRRSIQVERRYGDSKKHRGGRDFRGCGLSRATAETGLIVMAQNSLALYNLRKTTRDDST